MVWKSKLTDAYSLQWEGLENFCFKSITQGYATNPRSRHKEKFEVDLGKEIMTVEEHNTQSQGLLHPVLLLIFICSGVKKQSFLSSW